jgi:hypothetical protein
MRLIANNPKFNKDQFLGLIYIQQRLNGFRPNKLLCFSPKCDLTSDGFSKRENLPTYKKYFLMVLKQIGL